MQTCQARGAKGEQPLNWHLAINQEDHDVKHSRLLPVLFVFLAAVHGQSASAQPIGVDFVRLSGSVAQGTAVFRADLSSIALSEIRSITLIDSDSGTGGSPGQYSGFDLDAIKLSTTLATSAAQASGAIGLDVFDFRPSGTLFTPGTQRAPVNPKLNGTDPTGLNVDPTWATLASFDAVWFGTGSVTLGDGGRVAFNLTSPVSTSGLYLYIGEVSGDPGEAIAGSLLVSALPVPEPSTSTLILMGSLLVAGAARHRRRVAA